MQEMRITSFPQRFCLSHHDTEMTNEKLLSWEWWMVISENSPNWGIPLRHGLYKHFLFAFSFCAISLFICSYLDCYYLDKIWTVESHARYTVRIKPVLNLVFFKSKRKSHLHKTVLSNQIKELFLFTLTQTYLIFKIYLDLSEINSPACNFEKSEFR